MMMEKLTKRERSLYLLTANNPVIKAMMLAGNETATVTSHQRSSKLSILSTKTSTQEVTTAIRKKAFNPTDHLPSVVFGINIFPYYVIYNIKETNSQLFKNGNGSIILLYQDITWLAIIDDLRTFDWVENVPYPQITLKESQQYLS